MDFDQLETFLEVARLSSFSRAAEKRFRTQPAISSQIRALEEEVGAKLLDRSGGKVSLTASGKLFQKYAEDTRSEEHTSELQSRFDLVCRLLLEKKKKKQEPHKYS